jgi:hypothetical protein
MARGRDFEIVMALEVYPKVVQWEIEIEIYAVMGLQMWCINICNWTPT